MTQRPWTDDDFRWIEQAIELSHHCPPAKGAYSVGAIIVDRNGDEVARGYSREGGDLHAHAEQAALAKADRNRLEGGTIYCSLEPCSQRRSPTLPCAQRIARSGLQRVVISWREPDLFVSDCQGYELLTAAGLSVVEIPSLAAASRAANAHLPIQG
ncbi:deaminase [Streptomyces noursei]